MTIPATIEHEDGRIEFGFWTEYSWKNGSVRVRGLIAESGIYAREFTMGKPPSWATKREKAEYAAAQGGTE